MVYGQGRWSLELFELKEKWKVDGVKFSVMFFLCL